MKCFYKWDVFLLFKSRIISGIPRNVFSRIYVAWSYFIHLIRDWLRSIKNQYLRRTEWSMKIKFAKIWCIDDYIYVLEKNSRHATNYFKKKKNERNSYEVDKPWFSNFFKEIYFLAGLKNMFVYICFFKVFN